MNKFNISVYFIQYKIWDYGDVQEIVFVDELSMLRTLAMFQSHAKELHFYLIDYGQCTSTPDAFDLLIHYKKED